MKHKFTLLYFLLLFSIFAGAQNITGVWKGYFIQSNFGFSEDRYKFEVQIAQLTNDALTSVTYSYKTTVFYGKAEATGIYTKKTNNIIINELKLVDLKIAESSQPCLMTCYLEYNKLGDIETLTGTYSSRSLKGADCGSGKVYLEKSTTSDFYKEEFVIKRENELKKQEKPSAKKLNKVAGKFSTAKTLGIKPGAEDNLIIKPGSQNRSASAVVHYNKRPKPVNKTAPGATVKSSGTKPAAQKKSNTTIPQTKDSLVAKSNSRPVYPLPSTVAMPKKEYNTKSSVPPVIKILPKPEILKKRDNDLVKTITTSAKEFKIELYDNGEIDGDRISVYHNNELIVSNKMLTDKPISFTIKTDENTPVHEFVMVAENLGTIPPNTALMIITAGGKRYELFLTSTEQKNAVVRIEYKE